MITGQERPVSPGNLQEKVWWNKFGHLEERIWQYNRFLSWAVRSAYLREMTDFLYRENGTVLDVGCGIGWVGLRLAQAGMSLDGIDLSEAQIARAKRNAQALGINSRARFQCARAEDLAGSAQYDAIILHAVLHHLDIKAQSSLLYQIAALLRPGGRLYLYEPIATSPERPPIATLADKIAGAIIAGCRRVALLLRLTNVEIREARLAGWEMQSPSEAPLDLDKLLAQCPTSLSLTGIKCWHAYSVAYANFCMELKLPWQLIASPFVLLFVVLDKIVILTRMFKHSRFWPMATIKFQKKAAEFPDNPLEL